VPVRISDYSALRLPDRPARAPLIGVRDSNGATLYKGDWLRDVTTGFVMRAVGFSSSAMLILNKDGQCIRPHEAVLYTPLSQTKVGRIAFCDQAAHAAAVATRHVSPSPSPLTGPSVFETLDEWL
jgi:hypothetical protein